MIRASFFALAAGTAVAASPVAVLPPAAERPVDFGKDIAPIFEQSCGKCHGAEKQKGGFRLDVKDRALHGGDNYAPNLLPGKSAESPLIRFVAGLEPDMRMPSKGDPLTAAQIGLLRAWIDQGAPWPEDGASDPRKTHWAYQPVRPAAFPAGIDSFISARLTEKGVALSPVADRRTLIRRASFDVLGLPPTPEEIDAFSADRDPRAYEKLVDRLLASPRYGERWARHWLDVVRFAESDGFETNQPRPNAWPYRDYVIRAFNEDLPYDRFIREQLAGDALGAGEATGFIVGGPTDRVKSPDPVLTANQRADELHDMVGTTGATFLALTVNCARCHNHKFDPIPQTDYYAMKAVFAGVQHGERQIRGAENAPRHREAEALRPRLAECTAQLEALSPLAEPTADRARRAAVNSRRNVEHFSPVQATRLRFTIAETNNGTEPCIDELEVWSTDLRNVALKARATSSGNYAGDPKHQLAHLTDGQYGNGRSWIANTAGRGWVAIELATAETINRVVWARDREEKYRDRTPTRYTIEAQIDDGPWRTLAGSNDRAIAPPDKPAAPEWDAPALTPAQREQAARLDAERRDTEAKIATLSANPTAYAGKFDAQPIETRRFHRGDPMQPKEVIAPAGLSAFAGFHLTAEAPEQERRLALAKWIASPENPLTARVMVNRLWHYHFGTGLVETPSDFGLNGARPSHPELLDWLAGEFIARGWSVKAMHRLILTSATYRQSACVSDGVTECVGENPPPSNTPSRTYSHTHAREVDASNRLLWRFPPRRLEAEALRDSILAVSGELDWRAGGPGFDLFEPNTNYVKVYATKTKFAAGDFRRMVYQDKPRVELDTLFGAFDCPDAGQTQPRRTASTTPLQALNLLNSEFLLEQARFLAERLQRDAGADPAAQVRRAFALLFGREPRPEETAAAAQLIAAHGLPAFCRALYNANEFITIF